MTNLFLTITESIVFWYPISMGLLWIIGSLFYYFRLERKPPIPLTQAPMVSILVPAYNEADHISHTIRQLNQLNYPNYEIIIINDGSSDQSAIIEEQLAYQYERVRFLNLKENCGKANALYLGLLASKGEYLVCVDGDSYLDPDCLRYMIPHFIQPCNGERVGAVTGNPRVRNRSSLLAKLQLCEYASIISLIKRTQRMWGKVMTVSGVVVAYRKRALLDCGLWDRDLITEDIGVTWKLERRFWDIRYEPRAICWMLVPETLTGLFKQRKRWAQGGQEVLLRHIDLLKSWNGKRMLPILFEQIMSTTWVILWMFLTIYTFVQSFRGTNHFFTYIWKSQFLAIICMGQFLVAILLEQQYDKKMLRNFIVAAWYPLFYWVINGVVSICALPATIKSRNKTLATWNSPDRGISPGRAELAAATEKAFHTDSSCQTGSEIINGLQTKWKQVIESFITIFAWSFLLIYPGYLLYGCLCTLLHKKALSFLFYTPLVFRESRHFFMITVLIFLTEFIFMLFWKEYNRLRYASLHRRRFQPNVKAAELSRYFKQSRENIWIFQNEDVIIFHHNIIPEQFTGAASNHR